MSHAIVRQGDREISKTLITIFIITIILLSLK